MDCIGERILNAFCGAVAVYDEECKTFCFQYCPEKVVQLLGYDMPYFDSVKMPWGFCVTRTEWKWSMQLCPQSPGI